jgi:SulP family sulfate permease
MVCMTAFDFVIGVLFGIVLACKDLTLVWTVTVDIHPIPTGFFFVVQNSRTRSIRAVYTGDTAISTVRRPSAHRAYLQEVGRQTVIMKLQCGLSPHAFSRALRLTPWATDHLFFGTITHVEEAIRQLLETTQWTRNPIRFLVLDFSLVPGVDLSAAEAFVRVQRLLVSKCVTFVLCGFAMDSPIGLALQSVELFEGHSVEVFSEINQAIEWTENVYLKAWFESVKEAEPEARAIGESRTRHCSAISILKVSTVFLAFPGRQKFTLTVNGSSWENSPRKKHIRNAGGRLMRPQMQLVQHQSPSPLSPHASSQLDIHQRHQIREEPIPTLIKTFSGYESELSPELFVPMLQYFKRMELTEGQILWRRGDPPDGLYVIAAGVMRATYIWDNADSISESMVAGTLAGELTGLAGMPRNADVVAEKASVLWKLSNEDWALFKKEQPTLAHRFVELVLKGGTPQSISILTDTLSVAKNDYDTLIGACSRH